MKWLVVILIAVASLLSISQTILYVLATPPGYIFPFIHNFIEDYYQYLDIMRQGYDGWWGATSRLTPEVYARMPVSLFLLALGHIARIFHLWVPLMYTASRVLGGIALMILVYQLVKKTFPRYFSQLLVALAFVLYGTYWWGWGRGGPSVATLVHAWTELDPIFHWSFIPHHLWSKVFMLAAFLLLLRPSSIIHNSLFIILVIAMGLTNPVVYVTFIPTLVLYAILSLRVRHDILIAIVAAVPALLYHRYLQMNIFPWTSYRLWEQTLHYSVKPWDYAVSLGPTLPLFVLAIPTLWCMGSIGKLLIAWAGSSWVTMYIAGPFLPVTIERYLGGYQFIPLAIGTAVFVFSHKRLNLLCVVLLVYFSVGLYASFKEQAGYVVANRSNMQVYIPGDLMAALRFLDRNGNPEDVVMAPYEISTMIPALTGKRVLAGHTMFTKDVAAKRAAINDFFTTEDMQIATRTLSAYRISYILAPSTFTPAWSRSLLTQAYRNNTYVVYTTY